jgi:formate hydrogenlyase subunit 3/multisubunit Na+/H+ antiporter MnhD subunit
VPYRRIDGAIRFVYLLERNMPSRYHMRKVAAAAGVIGPALFAITVSTLSVIQYSFMRSLGWDPLTRPTFDWPSGLALGPLGWIMTMTFLVCGLLMSIFAWGLRGELRNRTGQIGTFMLT